MDEAQISLLPDRRRLHLHHGPIDLIVEAFGPEPDRDAAYEKAAARFTGLLEGLVSELPRLRSAEPGPVSGNVAQRMVRAIAPHRSEFVTPMAAVAGAVADEIRAAMVSDTDLDRAYVNNGGDIALYLAPGEFMRAAMVTGPHLRDHIGIDHADPVRGIATSGWRGRSWSFGIADAVTVLAADAAAADVAATLIANAVDLPGHRAITRQPANRFDPDSDLGARLVTTGVARLSPEEIRAALDNGRRRAEAMIAAGQISAALLALSGESLVCGAIKLLPTFEREPAHG